ncbi:MAG: NAD-dependent epimerase/dehydratase family protein [Verrucomicrobia bacterium]|nr:MAG: NAD-dependent epimerase/dehydratase family protein [Verrucomicrobiota bacterium]
MDCVVGSGPSGVACAAALLKRGRRVLMLDAGLRLEPERDALVKKLGRSPAENWSATDLARLKEGMNPGAAGIPQKLLFGSDFPYRDAERELGVDYGGTGLRASLAVGGLSTVWGSAMLPYAQQDIADWPITVEQLAPHYRAAVEITGLAAERDGLEELFPLYTETPGRLELSRQAKAIQDSLTRKAAALREAGIRFGRARVAIQAAGGGREPVCIHCGHCMYGCAYGCIYCSADTIARWNDNPNFSYQSGVIVDSVAESGEEVFIRGHNRGTNEPFELKAERVFLAAGVIPTTGILLRSAPGGENTAIIQDSQYFLLPALLTKRISNVQTERLHALSQLFVELLDPQISPHLVHLQVYTYSDLIGRALRNSMGALAGPLELLARELDGRMILFQGYLHSAHSSRMCVQLDRNANGGRGKLEMKPLVNPESARIVRRVAGKLLRNWRRLGAIPLTPMLKIAEPGRSFHSGGSFPMCATPGAMQTDLLGRPFGWQRVHAVDATVLPSVPATTITFTVMANAHRIATEADSGRSADASSARSQETETRGRGVRAPIVGLTEPTGKTSISVTNETKTCAITGSSGWVGGRLKNFLTNAGWDIVDWTRRPASAGKSVSFRLGEDVDPKQFAGVKALVHCAYDFSGRRWEDIERVNVRGSEKLLRAAKAAGVERIVFISTISAFDGCRSLYGKAKLEIEKVAREVGAVIIRPGLVYGEKPGGVFGGLVKQVQGGKFVPLIGGGGQLQFLVHEQDLGRFVSRCLAGEISERNPITVAHEDAWTMRKMLSELAAAQNKRVTFVPVPWRAVWLALKTLETLNLPAPFRSDSLISLVYQDTAPSFALAKSLGANCRAFAVKL